MVASRQLRLFVVGDFQFVDYTFDVLYVVDQLKCQFAVFLGRDGSRQGDSSVTDLHFDPAQPFMSGVFNTMPYGG